MRNPIFVSILLLFVIALDLYIFQVIKYLLQGVGIGGRVTIHIFYWLFCILSVIPFLLFPFINNPYCCQYFFSIGMGWFIMQLTMALFFLVDDIRRGSFWTYHKLTAASSSAQFPIEHDIPRSTFLSWLGIGLASTLFFTLLNGFNNKYNYRVIKKKIALKGLSSPFKGFKMIHISDIHSGSLQDKVAVQKGIDLIMQQQADLILFTGDLVNDKATEMKDWMEVFSQLTAPFGVFSTLGNHDYGDYVQWESPTAKQKNLEELMLVHSKLGWRLLMNEHVIIEKQGAKIQLVGIENWGAKARFPKYGQLDKAMKGVNNVDPIILMSHDPSHWEAQVIPSYPQIQLMLAGHTHGMQFGLENPYFKWSPVQWVYKQWAGLYTTKQQLLYVNRGFGFIGYPGRVGILPEITLIELI